MSTPPEMLLGKATPPAGRYAPELLFPISRKPARDGLAIGNRLPFSGLDIWHAYELSWLAADGRPLARVGRISIDAASPNIVESKSLKLYFNSLNNHRFDSEAAAVATIAADIGAVVGMAVGVELLTVDDERLSGTRPPGTCIDDAPFRPEAGAPSATMLEVDTGRQVDESIHSHLLRSLCPVTGQPDWATVWLHYRGPALEHGSLLRYILAYREHQEFHEQCAERMFCDLSQRLKPESLTLQACYTRRGGLDINPLRSNDPKVEPLGRLNRQ